MVVSLMSTLYLMHFTLVSRPYYHNAIVNLFHFPFPPSPQTATKAQLEDAFYDRFNLTISSVQVMVAGGKQDWNAVRTHPQSQFHIMRPICLEFAVQKSLLPNDTKLAE